MLKTTSAFTLAYNSLNQEQQVAVDTIDGPVMVIAGPGTGKTQILATRIANILLKTDTNPSSILALTFTESGASAMKKRLISLIGQAAYAVRIQTFHSFCSDVISSHPEFFPLDIQSEPLTDLDRYQLFEQILSEHNFQYIKPINSPYFYLKSLVKNIQDLKREGITPEKFQVILAQEGNLIETDSESWKKVEREKRTKSYQKNLELLEVYRLYQQQLVERHRYDFEDMIALTVQAFHANELLLLEFQEKFQYFLVDEYQDTNSAQNQVITQLASYWGEEANVFVVGDPNQSIYRFQGASLENTFQFLTFYPNATVITLKQNYRSSQTILDAAQSVIAFQQQDTELPIQIEQGLQSQQGRGQSIQVFVASSNTVEYVYIAETIRELIGNGVPAEEIAILYRNNTESRLISDILSRFGIQYEIEGGADILDHPTIVQLLLLCSVIRDIRYSVEDVNLFTLLNYDWLHLNSLMILKLLRFAQEKKQALYTVVINEPLMREFCERDGITATECEAIGQLSRKLAYWSGLDAQLAFLAWFEVVINDSGFLNYLLDRSDSVEQLNVLNTLFSEIKRLSLHDSQMKLEGFLLTIQTMVDHGITLPEVDLNIEQNSVRLVTAHKSKGLEWDTVFITGLVDKKWGNSVNRSPLKLPEGILQFSKNSSEEQLNDDRRLFYVALTRAKTRLYVTYSKTVQAAQGQREATPSQFLEEIDAQYKEFEKTFELQQNIPLLLNKILQTRQPRQPSVDEHAFINSVLEHFKLSSTGLNTYLECAYKFKLNVLFKVPRAKPSYMAFGTAIHKALEFLFAFMKDQNSVPSLDQLLLVYKTALEKELLSESDFIVRLAQGQTVLTQYYQEYHQEFKTPLFVERPFGIGFSMPYLDDIPLSGKVDKIELIDAGNKSVKVVDYKTGKPKTRNEIEGKTKNSTGAYKRQLVFYKLLTDLDKSFKLTVEQAEFDFVQPKENGTFVKHSFHIDNLEVEELKTVIREVMVKIRAHEFPKTDDYSICHDCLFRHHCWPDGIPEKIVG